MAKVLLVQKTFLEMFGVMSLAAVLKSKGYEVEISLERGASLAREASVLKPDIVGFSSVSMNVHANLTDAALLKKSLPGCKTVFGGVHPTFFPETVEQPYVDAVCRGEGEYALAEYASAVEAGGNGEDILNLAVRKNGGVQANPLRPVIEDLDELPFADRSSYYERYPFLKNNPVKNFLCSRGCPFKCTFCFNAKYVDLYSECGVKIGPRMRSPENVIEEIRHFRARWPLENIAFQDENFCLNKKWLYSFLDVYGRDVSLPFFCMVNASIIDDETASALKKAGCRHTTFGIESGDEAMRAEILGKKVTDDQIRKTAELLKRNGITFHTTNIFCFPGETVESAMKTIRLNAEISPFSAITFKFMPFANLGLTSKAIESGWLTQEASRDWSRLPNATVRIPGWRRILRIRSMFMIGVRAPRAIPLIEKLSALPIGLLAQAVFAVLEAGGYYMRNRHSLGYMVKNLTNLRRLQKSYRME